MKQAPQTRETRTKLGSLEIGRFIAAFMVMLSHVAPYVNRHAANPGQPIFGGLLFPGPLGVQYFFTLSGFVMATAHHRDFGKFASLPKFWWRRACRIYPAYWLALCIPVYYLYHALNPALTAHLMLLDPWNDVEYIPATWSMRYELAFYIGFGLCLLPYVGKPILAFWVVFTFWRWCGPLVNLFHPHYMMATYWLTQDYAVKFFSFMEFYFFAGLLAGFIYACHPPGLRTSIGIAAIAFGLFALRLHVEDWGLSYSRDPMFMLSMAFMLAGCILGLALLEHHRILRLGRIAAWAGAMSYPLYILHEPVLLLIDNNHPWGNFHARGLYTHFVVIIALTLALTAAVTFLFDQPLQRALRHLTRRVWTIKGKGGFAPLDPPPGAEPLDLKSF